MSNMDVLIEILAEIILDYMKNNKNLSQVFVTSLEM